MIKSLLIFSSSFYFLGALVISKVTLGSACCGGGLSVPSIIAGDDRQQLSTSYSYSKVHADVSASGIWQRKANEDITQILKLDYASIIEDRFQFGVSLPIHQRNVQGLQGGQSQGLGDTALQGGYEYLPDWDYHPYRPKGIGYISLTLPTGKSLYEEDNLSGLDSRGRGFWALGAGTLLTKTFKKIDTLATLELHKSFSKPVHNSQFQGTIEPGWGYSYSLGIGYNMNKLRLGHALLWSYEDPIQSQGNIVSKGNYQSVATGSFSVSYLTDQLLTVSLTYSDQTLYGEPTNTGLNKTILLSLLKRWSR